ncbi:SRPBCC family protein [Spongorhabdus nitratireducens]
MTQHVEQSLQVHVPAGRVWAVLDDFSSIEHFSPTVKHSPVEGSKQSGLGAQRVCQFHDGTSAVEEIIDYREGESLKVELRDHPMPFKKFYAFMKVKPVNQQTSILTMAMEFDVKFGPLGWLMANILMKPMMRKVLKKILTGLAYHSATGKSVGKELPAKAELKAIFN